MSDHKAKSERIMSLLNENVIAIEGQTDATMIATAIDALRHATLYAAEQQRIANLQVERGLLFQKSGRRVGTEAAFAADEAHRLDAQIRDGLGLR